MSEELLRSAFERLASTVRPEPDPLGRLRARYRRRWRVRLGVVAAGLAVAVGAGTLALAPAGPHLDQNPIPRVSQPVEPPFTGDTTIRTDRARALLDTPTRGNLAGDTRLAAEVLAGFRGRQQIWGVPKSYTRVHLLLMVGDTEQRTFLAAYTDPGETHGVVVSASAPLAATVDRMTAADAGADWQLAPTPVLRVKVFSDPDPGLTYSLVPPGCVLSSSTDLLTWTDHGDWAPQPGTGYTVWWRTTCDGRVQEVDPGYTFTQVPDGAWPAVAERGSIPPELVLGAKDQWMTLPGWNPTSYRAVWGGPVPGSPYPYLVVTGTGARGTEVTAVTGTFNGMGRRPITQVGGAAPKLPVDPAMLSTSALVPSPDFVAVRVLDPVQQWRLGDDLLVVAPKGTLTLTASNGATPIRVDDGVWLVKAPPPATVTLTASPGGTTITVAEPHAPGILFGQPVGPLW